jgi:hypothetical protein
MIRRIPGSEHRLIEGVTWTWTNNQARVVYLPRGQSASKVLERARDRWEARLLPDSDRDPDAAAAKKNVTDSLRRAVRCELGKDGRVTVSFKTDLQDDPVRFLVFLNLYCLQWENGSVGAQ